MRRRTSFFTADFHLRLKAPNFGAIEGKAQSRDVPFSAYSFVARQKSKAECADATARFIHGLELNIARPGQYPA